MIIPHNLGWGGREGGGEKEKERVAPTAAVVVVVVAMMMVVVVTACRIRKKKDMAEDVSDVVELAFSRNSPSICCRIPQKPREKIHMSLPIQFPVRRTAPDMTDSLRPSQKRDWGWGGVEHERKRNGRADADG